MRRTLISRAMRSGAAFALGCAGVSAHAAVSDIFDCTLRLTNSTGSKTYAESTTRAGATRIPQFALPPTTEGSLSVGLKGRTFEANLSLQYQHATTSGLHRAYQWTCLSMSYCDTSSPSGNCVASACALANPDPADPFNGWTPVPFLNGIPMFDPARLVEDTWELEGNRVLRGSCTHVQTIP